MKRLNIPIFELSIDNALKNGATYGFFLKWRIKYNNKYIWVKTSNYIELLNTWLWESYSEIIAYYLGQDLGIKNILKYYPCVVSINNQKLFGCYSYDFNEPKESFVSIGRLQTLKLVDTRRFYLELDSGYESLLRQLKNNLGIDYKDELDNILLFDSVILNTDRHFGNFGFRYNRETNKWRKAPIFDNGCSLYSGTYKQGDFNNLLTCEIESLPFKSIHLEQLQYTKYRNGLNRDINISRTFKTIDDLEINFGLTANRANFIKSLLIERIKVLGGNPIF